MNRSLEEVLVSICVVASSYWPVLQQVSVKDNSCPKRMMSGALMDEITESNTNASTNQRGDCAHPFCFSRNYSNLAGITEHTKF